MEETLIFPYLFKLQRNHVTGYRNGLCHSLMEVPVGLQHHELTTSPTADPWRRGGMGREGHPAQVIPLPKTWACPALGLHPPCWVIPSWGRFSSPKNAFSLLFLRIFLVLRDQRLFCSQRILHTPLNSCHSEKPKTSAHDPSFWESLFPFFSIRTSETTF